MTAAPTSAERGRASRARRNDRGVGVIAALSASHMLNDTMQSLAPALYPVFREKFALTFFQIGVITFVFQITASLAPAADRHASRPAAGQRDPARSAWPSRWSAWLLLAFARLLSAAPAFGRRDRDRQRGLSSRGLARRARWHPADGMASRRACFRSAAISASRSGPCSRRSSSCRSASIRCSPSPCLRWSRSGF